MKTKQTKTCISTYGGDFFDFHNPEGHDYDIKVIAHSLSNLCRFNGHSNKFYSVAEHSVLVSRLVPPQYALIGLLHDASEAYCGDVSSPLKRLLPDYRRIEERVQQAISVHFGLPKVWPEDIHLADKRLYLTERKTITNSTDALWHTDLEPADILVAGMDPKNAKAFFLSRYKEVTSDSWAERSRRKEAA